MPAQPGSATAPAKTTSSVCSSSTPSACRVSRITWRAPRPRADDLGEIAFHAAARQGRRRAARIETGDRPQEALLPLWQRGVRLAVIEEAGAQTNQLAMDWNIRVVGAKCDEHVAVTVHGAAVGPR